MRNSMRAVALGFVASLALAATQTAARAETVTVPKDTPVVLVFDQGVSTKTAKEGQTVALHVRDDVNVNGTDILPRGTRVTGVIAKVDKRKRFGVNAKMRLAFNPVRSAFGTPILLGARSQGKYVEGKKSGTAAAASGGGAMVLGPIGLVGGYFVHGKSITIKPGDTVDTVVTNNTILRR